MNEPPPPPDGRVLGWLSGLTLGNVLVMALLAVVAVPVYVIYRALGDEALLDRLLSTYEVIESREGCAVRHVQERGGPSLWGVSSGFAYQGEARWYVNVMLDHPPGDEVAAYCATLKLIADSMLQRGDLLPGSVPGAGANGSGHDGDMPAGQEEEK